MRTITRSRPSRKTRQMRAVIRQATDIELAKERRAKEGRKRGACA